MPHKVESLMAENVKVPNDGDFVMAGKPLKAAGGLHWDQVNSRLGVGTDSPGYTLDVNGTINTGTLNTGALTATSEVLKLSSSTGTSNAVALSIQNFSSSYTQIANGFGSRIQFLTNRGTNATSVIKSADIKGYIYGGAGGTGDYHALDLDAYGDNSSLSRGISIYGKGSGTPVPADVTVHGNLTIGNTVSGDGSGLTNLDADNINAGTLTRPISTSTGVFTHVSLGTSQYPTLGGNWLTIFSPTFDGDIGNNHPDPDGGILFTNTSSSSRFPWGYYMGVVKDVASTNGTTQRFDIGKSSDLNSQDSTEGSDSLTPYLTIDNGNVGIGTTSPSAPLHVNATSAIIIPVGTTAQQPTGQTGMLRFNTSVGKLEVYNGIAWNTITSNMTASGGTVTYYDGYTIHTFTTSGTFTVYSVGEIEYLVVAGGGGGGFDGGGGGGGGGARLGTITLTETGTYTITVGAGGAPATTVGSQASSGTNSSIGTLVIANGGGGGGSKQANGVSGGSGGGGGHSGTYTFGGTGITGEGRNGGAGVTVGGGGGGGAGGTGTNASASSNSAGLGGNGLNTSFSGINVYYAAGGGGGTYNSGTAAGTGGLFGGGNGGGANESTNPSTPGTANTGGGGGGDGVASGLGASQGGSGIVIIRYLT